MKCYKDSPNGWYVPYGTAEEAEKWRQRQREEIAAKQTSKAVDNVIKYCCKCNKLWQYSMHGARKGRVNGAYYEDYYSCQVIPKINKEKKVCPICIDLG